MKKVSFVVPVFNEQENIGEFYRRITKVMAPFPYDYELLFIDDGSSDRSPILLQELVDKDSQPTCLPGTLATSWLLPAAWTMPPEMR